MFLNSGSNNTASNVGLWSVDNATKALYGGIGNDSLFGGLGNDILTGGIGNDTFIFNTALNATSNRDTITDFSHSDDTIQLSKSIMSKLGALGTLSAAIILLRRYSISSIPVNSIPDNVSISVPD